MTKNHNTKLTIYSLFSLQVINGKLKFDNNIQVIFSEVDFLKEVPRKRAAPIATPRPKAGRKLQGWRGGYGTGGRENGLAGGDSRGWSPEAMFRANRALGVQSTFSMDCYTNVDARAYTEK